MPFSIILSSFSVWSSGTSEAPGVFWTQWMGQSRDWYVSEGLDGLVMVVNEVKGSVPGWLVENEMCVAGCQSFVAILRVNGRVRRVLIVGIMVRPWGTARLPF